MDVTRRTERETSPTKWDGLMPTVILTLCLLAAGALGCITAGGAADDAAHLLSSYLQSYLALFAGETSVTPSVWAVIWELCRWQVLVLILGSTALGAVAIPGVFCVRGFLLGYSIAAFVRVFGEKGILGALAVFGVAALIGVPVMLGVGSVTFPAALHRAVYPRGEDRSGASLRAHLVRLAPCGALLALAVVFQWSLAPQLLGIVSTALITS
jgi:hypothetical protein